VGDGLVGEGGRAMGSSNQRGGQSKSAETRWGVGTKRDRCVPNNHFGNTVRWW